MPRAHRTRRPNSVRTFGRSVVVAAFASVDVAQTPGSYVGWTSTGTASYNPFSPSPVNGFLGGAVAVVGDLNFDGVDDVLAQAGTGAFLRALSGVDGTTLYTMTGTLGSDFGRAVARMPDLNADGTADFVVGTPGHSSPGTPSNGRVELRSGATGAGLRTVFGVGTSARFGESVAEIGDVDADGVPDVAVGAPDHLVAPLGPGSVTIFSGATGAPVATATATAPGSYYGASLAGGFDFDADGDPDLAVAVPEYSVSGATGRVEILDAASGALVAALLPHTSPSFRFGQSFGVGGDLTGDGVADVVVGAPATSTAGLNLNGAVTVRSRYGLTAGGALPFLLSAVGLSACPLLASPDLLFFSDTSGGGATVFPFPLVPSPGLAGLTLYAQTYVATSAAPLAGGVTSGLAITLQ